MAGKNGKPARKNGKIWDTRQDDPHYRDEAFRKQQRINALTTGAHLLLTALIDDGPLNIANRYGEDGKPDAETCGHITDAEMYTRTVNELMQMAMNLAYGDKS